MNFQGHSHDQNSYYDGPNSGKASKNCVSPTGGELKVQDLNEEAVPQIQHNLNQQTASFHHINNPSSSHYFPSSLVTFNNTHGSANLLDKLPGTSSHQASTQDRYKDNGATGGAAHAGVPPMPPSNKANAGHMLNVTTWQPSTQKHSFSNEGQVGSSINSGCGNNNNNRADSQGRNHQSATLLQILENVNEISKQLEQKQLLGSPWPRPSNVNNMTQSQVAQQ